MFSLNIRTQTSSVSSRTALFMKFFIVLDKYLASEVGSCNVCGLQTDKGSSAFILLTTWSLYSECICEMEIPRQDQK